MLSIDGLASGIDTTTIIEGLLEIQQRQISQLTERKTLAGVEQASFSGLESRLLALRNDLSELTSSGGSVFRSRTATSSNEQLVTAAATSKAPTGSYQITINQLAQSHQVASQGFADEGALLTQGQLEIQVGDGNAATITIDSSNNTLQGLVDAINRSGAGVTAAVINDGAAEPYRLLLTSQTTGESNDIRITNNLAAGSGSETQPVFDLGNAIQDPRDASATLGSGAGAITVSSATNQLDGVIPGVSLNLLGADVDAPVTISVVQDSQATIDAANGFLESYNSLMSYIDSQSKFTAETETAGPLLGNRTVIRIQDDLRLLVTESIGNLNPSLNRLTAAGFSLDDQGKLQLNEGRLRDVLEGRVEGVDDEDVARLFALGADSDNSGVSFIFGSTRTKEGGVEVDITSAASRAVLTATSALSASTVIDSSNNILQISVDGNEASVTLASGAYTNQELADLIETQLNNHNDLPGREVQVSLDADLLRIESQTVGSSSKVDITGGTALAALGFASGATARGQDVVGKFIVNGVEEPATGNGSLLVGDSDNEFTGDLQVRVALTASQILSGSEANLTITRGIASRLDRLLNEVLDPVNGRMKAENDRYDGQIDSIQESIDRLQAQFEAQQEALVSQFVSLESTISDLKNTGNFLASQLGGANLLAQ